MQLYKVLGADGAPHHGGYGKWHLPYDNQPGDWMPPIIGELVQCRNGYHLCRADQLLMWLGPTVWRAEYLGEYLDAEDKIVVRQARLLSRVETWNERTGRLLAADFAEHVLPVFKRHHPNDLRPRKTIETIRRFANGEATRGELGAAESEAVGASNAGWAVSVASWAAGQAARCAASSRPSWETVRVAAGEARLAASQDGWSLLGKVGGGQAEREWQAARLLTVLGEPALV